MADNRRCVPTQRWSESENKQIIYGSLGSPEENPSSLVHPDLGKELTNAVSAADDCVPSLQRYSFSHQKTHKMANHSHRPVEVRNLTSDPVHL